MAELGGMKAVTSKRRGELTCAASGVVFDTSALLSAM